MSRSAVTVLLLAAIIIAVALAAFLLRVPVLMIAVGVGALGGGLMAYASRARRKGAGASNDSAPRSP